MNAALPPSSFGLRRGPDVSLRSPSELSTGELRLDLAEVVGGKSPPRRRLEALAKSDGPLRKTLNLNTRSTPNQLSRHGL